MLFVKDHDGERWGLPYLDSSKSVGVARLAAVVRQVGLRDGLTVREAVDLVLDRLAINGVVPEFTFDEDAQRPVPIELQGAGLNVHVWRPAYCSGRDWVNQSRSSAYVARRAHAMGAPWADETEAWAFMPEVEALGRGLLVRGCPTIGTRLPANAGTPGLHLTTREWESLPAVPELAGADGAIPWLRILWGEVRRFDELDIGLEARLAIRDEVAQRLFAADSEALDDGDSAALLDVVALPLRPGRTLDDKRQAAQRLRELKAKRVKSARKVVAKEFGVAERTIGKWIAEVEDAGWANVIPISSRGAG